MKIWRLCPSPNEVAPPGAVSGCAPAVRGRAARAMSDAAGGGGESAPGLRSAGLAGLFGLRRGAAAKGKATRAHLGDELSMYYNEEARARCASLSQRATAALSVCLCRPRVARRPPVSPALTPRARSSPPRPAAEDLGGARQGGGGARGGHAGASSHPLSRKLLG